MKIKEGGALSNLTRSYNHKTIESISVSYSSTTGSFELMINEDCLSYLSIEEVIALRKELKEALEEMLKQT